MATIQIIDSTTSTIYHTTETRLRKRHACFTSPSWTLNFILKLSSKYTYQQFNHMPSVWSNHLSREKLLKSSKIPPPPWQLSQQETRNRNHRFYITKQKFCHRRRKVIRVSSFQIVEPKDNNNFCITFGHLISTGNNRLYNYQVSHKRSIHYP